LFVALVRSFQCGLFYVDLLEFFLAAVGSLSVPPILADCVRRCAAVSVRPFMTAVKRCEFARRFARAMLRLRRCRDRDSSPALIETLTVTLRLFDSLRFQEETFRFLFEHPEFAVFAASLFYDESTARLASVAGAQVLEHLQAPHQTIQFIFKFIVTKLFSEHLPARTLNYLIEAITSGFKANPAELGSVFAETHFLERLIAFCVDLRATSSIEAIVTLLSHCLTNPTSFTPGFEVFSKLEPLVDGSVADYLIGMAFADDAPARDPQRRATVLTFPLFPGGR
jgi:hypothetical protein